MAQRSLSETVLKVHPDLVGRSLASPVRRILALVLDVLILFVPSLLVSVSAALLALYLSDPAALRAIGTLFSGQIPAGTEANRVLGDLAPLLVRIDAPGLPPAVKVAVEESDLDRAAELLSGSNFDFTISADRRQVPVRPGHIMVPVERFIPRLLRTAALLGLAALYFTFFTSRGRKSTPGKWLMKIQVLRLDGRPLTLWEGFERFGSYLASLGTVGLGLLDFWRDVNRRLAHDRVAHTVVVRRIAR